MILSYYVTTIYIYIYILIICMLLTPPSAATATVSAESLGEYCADDNKQFFAASSAKAKGMSQLHLWSYFYPLGTINTYAYTITMVLFLELTPILYNYRLTSATECETRLAPSCSASVRQNALPTARRPFSAPIAPHNLP